MTAAKRKKQKLRRSVTRLQEKVDHLCEKVDQAIHDMRKVRDFAEARGREYGDIQTRRMAEQMHKFLSTMPLQQICIDESLVTPPTTTEGDRKP